MSSEGVFSPTRPTSRWPALATLCAGRLMVILYGTVVTVALPSIQDSPGFSPSSLAWVINAYLIPTAALVAESRAHSFGEMPRSRLVGGHGAAVAAALVGSSSSGSVAAEPGLAVAATLVLKVLDALGVR